MQRDFDLGIFVLHRADEALHRDRRRPGHRVGEHHALQADAMLGARSRTARDQVEHALDRDVAGEIAAEGGHDAATLTGTPRALYISMILCCVGRLLLGRAVLVEHQEGRRRRQHDRARDWSRPVASARSNPLSLSQSAGIGDCGRGVMPFTTSSASAMPGTALGLTKDTIWMWSRPVCDSASINSILRAVVIAPFLELKSLARAFLADVHGVRSWQITHDFLLLLVFHLTSPEDRLPMGP